MFTAVKFSTSSSDLTLACCTAMTSNISNPSDIAQPLPVRSILQEYYRITKPRVVGLIMFTAVAGMFLAVPGMPNPLTVFLATLGIGLSAAAGAAVNHVLDEEKDAQMKRTRNRPIPTGRLETGSALIFACVLAGMSMIILSVTVNVLTSLLTFASLIGYAVI